MKQIPIIACIGGAILCTISIDQCAFDRHCTNHNTAGDYRSEDGWQPVLQGLLIDKPSSDSWAKGEGTVFCKCFVEGKRQAYEDPDEYFAYEARLMDLWVGNFGPILAEVDISPQLPLMF